MQEPTLSPAVNRGSRRMRRMARRAKAFAPVLAVPAIFGLLALTMNLIEVRPEQRERPARGAARPATRAALAGHVSRRAADAGESVGAQTVLAPDPALIEGVLAVGVANDAAWPTMAQEQDQLAAPHERVRERVTSPSERAR